MILHSIRMRNIRSYTDEKLVFPEGSILLAGDIGSGKSSILHSIEFALFGARRDSISGDALLRKGKDDGEVELNFQVEGKDVVILRKLKRRRDSVAQEAGFIIIDNKKLECTPTELKARILNLLGYPKEMLTKSKSLVYRYTVYTPQEEMKHILLEGHEQRVDTLRKVFGIDRYKRVAENSGFYARSLKERRKVLAGVAQGLDEKITELKSRQVVLDAAKQRVQDLTPKLEYVRSVKKEKLSELDVIETERSQLEDSKKKSGILEARLMEIVKQRSRNNSEMEEINAGIKHLNDKLESVDEKEYPLSDAIEKNIVSKENELADLNAKMSALAERAKQIDSRIAQMNKDIEIKSSRVSAAEDKRKAVGLIMAELSIKDNVSSELESIGKNLAEISTSITKNSTSLNSSNNLKAEISGLDECPTCRQKVDAVHKSSIIDTEDRKIAKLVSEIGSLEKDKASTQSKVNDLSEKLKQLVIKENGLAVLKVELNNIYSVEKELKETRRLCEEYTTERKRISNDSADNTHSEKLSIDIRKGKDLLKEIRRYEILLSEKKHNLELVAEKQKRKDELTSLQDSLRQEVGLINNEKRLLSEKMLGLSSVAERFALGKEVFERILSEEKELEVEIGKAGKEAEALASIVSSIEKDVKSKEDALREHGRLGILLEWIEKIFMRLMGVMERQVLARVHGQFSELFSSWFRIMIEDEVISVRLDDSFYPVVSQNGHETNLESLSGGEKTSIALAYRLALNRVINDMISSIRTRSLLILDEPTDGFSSDQLDRVRNVLDELNTRQTIIVSHESKIESFVDHIIHINKDEHISRVIRN
ncbi:SMC family ATPase [Candidatus Woesearchaeota archaeon]|nr:SMC family ATPase [Candidatus Woesearchaeota archaeon]